MENFFSKKRIIGMVHLKNISNSLISFASLDKIYESAKRDLEALEEGGADAAIIENFFDSPYTTQLTLDTVVAYTNIFSRLKSIAKIPLGVNLQQTNNIEEIIIANICGGSFIRSEAFVETRVSASGILLPQASSLVGYKRSTKSQVSIFADINVKHSKSLVNQSMEDSIEEAINARADAIIITGTSTGKSPKVTDLERIKDIAKNTPIIVGSGVNEENISSFFKYANGIIVGSSIKEDGLDTPISAIKVSRLVQRKELIK